MGRVSGWGPGWRRTESQFYPWRVFGTGICRSQRRSYSRRLPGGASNRGKLGNEGRRGLAPGFDLSHLRGGPEASEELGWGLGSRWPVAVKGHPFILVPQEISLTRVR